MTDTTNSQTNDILDEQIDDMFETFACDLHNLLPDEAMKYGKETVFAILEQSNNRARMNEAELFLVNLHDNKSCSTCYGNYCRFRDHLSQLQTILNKGGK
jgi:hypothetical protein